MICLPRDREQGHRRRPADAVRHRRRPGACTRSSTAPARCARRATAAPDAALARRQVRHGHEARRRRTRSPTRWSSSTSRRGSPGGTSTATSGATRSSRSTAAPRSPSSGTPARRKNRFFLRLMRLSRAATARGIRGHAANASTELATSAGAEYAESSIGGHGTAGQSPLGSGCRPVGQQPVDPARGCGAPRAVVSSSPSRLAERAVELARAAGAARPAPRRAALRRPTATARCAACPRRGS